MTRMPSHPADPTVHAAESTVPVHPTGHADPRTPRGTSATPRAERSDRRRCPTSAPAASAGKHLDVGVPDPNRSAGHPRTGDMTRSTTPVQGTRHGVVPEVLVGTATLAPHASTPRTTGSSPKEALARA